jgi:hypothetical protein
MILILVVGVVAAIIIPIVLLESRRTPGWQAALEQYLEASDLNPQDIQSEWAAEARAVDCFPSEMTSPVPTGWTWEGVAEVPSPERARCIRLERREGKTDQRALDEHLVVGYHDDGLYHAGWLVHEFRPDVSQAEREAWFVNMGCRRWTRVPICGG